MLMLLAAVSPAITAASPLEKQLTIFKALTHVTIAIRLTPGHRQSLTMQTFLLGLVKVVTMAQQRPESIATISRQMIPVTFAIQLMHGYPPVSIIAVSPGHAQHAITGHRQLEKPAITLSPALIAIPVIQQITGHHWIFSIAPLPIPVITEVTLAVRNATRVIHKRFPGLLQPISQIARAVMQMTMTRASIRIAR